MTEHFKIRSIRYATVVGRWVVVAAMVFFTVMLCGIYITNNLLASEGSSADKQFCYAITAAFGGMLAIMISSSVEICLLIVRADAAANELLPPR